MTSRFLHPFVLFSCVANLAIVLWYGYAQNWPMVLFSGALCAIYMVLVARGSRWVAPPTRNQLRAFKALLRGTSNAR
jgi:cobalamin biosynthesis protein CobD/CbiB